MKCEHKTDSDSSKDPERSPGFHNLSTNAGKPADPSLLLNVPNLIADYYCKIPDPTFPLQRISFGTSGHRGSAFQTSFNENHILAITQAICLYRKFKNISGPLFMGIDTHALSIPAFTTALEVLAANNIEVKIAEKEEYTPTPVISHAILNYNRAKSAGLADGIVITPSHNPPADGGFKYNPPHGGPASSEVTSWIEKSANGLLEEKLVGVKRIPYERALRATTTHTFDYLNEYIADLENVVDMELIRASGIHLGVDPLGGAGVHYWEPLAQRYGLNLEVVNQQVDATFRFMTYDWDGQIRMDPSSVYAMQNLVALKEKFDLCFACDTDHDRHGIVCKSTGLMPPNHFLVAAMESLFRTRTDWSRTAGIGKTFVSSQMIDKVGAQIDRNVYEVPVGFKWFTEGLLNSTLGFCGEESAGASFLRSDGHVWTTDKDGIVPCLLAAEMMARTGRDPADIYERLTKECGKSNYDRIEAPATRAQNKALARLSPKDINATHVAGEKIISMATNAAGNGAPFGGIKVSTQSSWFAARPSGTESIYKIYAESFQDSIHFDRLLHEAQSLVDQALSKLLEGP